MNKQLKNEKSEILNERIKATSDTLDAAQRSAEWGRLAAKRFGFAQLVITGVSIVLSIAAQNPAIAIVINVVTVPFLLRNALIMAKCTKSHERRIEQLQRELEIETRSKELYDLVYGDEEEQ